MLREAHHELFDLGEMAIPGLFGEPLEQFDAVAA